MYGISIRAMQENKSGPKAQWTMHVNSSYLLQHLLGSAWEEGIEWNEKNIFRIFFPPYYLGVLTEGIKGSFLCLGV